MRFFFATCLAAACVTSACAQRVLPFAFENEARLPATVPFGYVRVVDNRADKDDLGFIRTGSFNRAARLHTEGDFGAALQQYCNSLLPQDANAADTLLLVLHNFAIEDRPNGDELGTFYFRGRFYLGGNDRYQYLREIDSLYEIRDDWDVTRKIRQLPSLRIYRYLSRMEAPTVAQDLALHMAEAVNSVQTEKAQFPIYQAGQFTKGIYRTLDDFLQQRVSDTAFIQVNQYTNNGNRPLFYFPNKKGKRGEPVKDVFAVYNGQQWYHPAPGGWARIYHENGDFFWTDHFTGIRNKSGEIIIASMFFGAIGGIIAATGNPRSANCWYRARLHPTTGRMVPVRRVN